MPTISGAPDSVYNSYQARVNDIENDVESERASSKKKQAEREARMEENHLEQLAKKDKVTEDAIVEIKHSANDIVEKNRKLNDDEISKLKKQTYDRLGRTNGLEADVLKEQLDTSKQGYEDQIKKNHDQMDRSDQFYAKKLSEQEEGTAEKLQNVAGKLKENYQEATENAGKNSNEQIAQYKKNLQDQYQELNEMNMFDQNAFRRFASSKVTDAQRDASQKEAHANEAAEFRMNKIEKNSQNELVDTMDNVRHSRAEENKGLRDQVKDLVAYKSQYLRDMGDARAGVIKNVEDDYRNRESNAIRSYEQVIDGMKSQSKISDKEFSRKQNEAIKEKDLYFSKLIAEQNAEHGSRELASKDAFARGTSEMTQRHRSEMEKTRNSYGKQLQTQNEVQADVMAKQAKANSDTLNRVKSQERGQVKLLEKELQNRKTSSDTNLVTPAAEESLRNKVVAEYETKFSTEKARNREGTDRILQNYGDIISSQQMNSTLRETDILRQAELDKQTERNAFLNHISDVEQLAGDKVNRKEQDIKREGDALLRNYAQSLDRQQKEQQEVVANQRIEFSARHNQSTSDLEFKHRLAQRAFSSRQNELVRDYEKKLSDLKDDLSLETKLQKDNFEQQLRETKRQGKMSQDEQGQMYEQKIAQMAAQQKERERYITQNFEQEIDKVRRSYVLASKKKS